MLFCVVMELWFMIRRTGEPRQSELGYFLCGVKVELEETPNNIVITAIL